MVPRTLGRFLLVPLPFTQAVSSVQRLCCPTLWCSQLDPILRHSTNFGLRVCAMQKNTAASSTWAPWLILPLSHLLNCKLFWSSVHKKLSGGHVASCHIQCLTHCCKVVSPLLVSLEDVLSDFDQHLRPMLMANIYEYKMYDCICEHQCFSDHAFPFVQK